MEWALWAIAAFCACLYCLVRGALDFRRGRYVWGALGMLSGLILLLMPMQTHAVKVDLPIANR